MYKNDYNERLKMKINEINRRAMVNDSEVLGGETMVGGFIGPAIASMLVQGVPKILGSVAKAGLQKLVGNGECECEGGAMDFSAIMKQKIDSARRAQKMEGSGLQLDKLRNRVGEGLGKGSKRYHNVDEMIYGGAIMSGNVAGTIRDTGFDRTVGIEGSGMRTIGGMIARKPINVPYIETDKPLQQVAEAIITKPPQQVVEKSVMKASTLSGFGKRDEKFLERVKRKIDDGKKLTKKEQDKLMMMKPRLEGMGFWDGLKQGFMSVIKPVASIAKTITGFIPHPAAQVASGVLGALGAGKKRGRPSKMKGGATIENVPHPAVELIKKQKKNADKVLDGGAYKLKASKVPESYKKKGGAKKSNPYMDLVMKTKKETGKSLKETMKYIKENNLYKK